MEGANQSIHRTREKLRAADAPRSAYEMKALRKCLLPIVLTVVMFGAFACSRSGAQLPSGTRADRIVVEKSARRLTLLANGRELRSYKIALGRNPRGPKVREGDNRTPEGSYVVVAHNDNSGYHRALRISYPNERDREAAKTAGVSPGGNIMIHGIRNGFGWLGSLHRMMDWTRGCIAVTDDELDEIARVVPDGARVDIRP